MTIYDDVFGKSFPFAIGFDRTIQLLNRAEHLHDTSNYPPYNIELISEDQYRIVMAVAGFSQDELEIQSEHQSLTVTGKKQKKDEEVTYLHRGIAARDFEHKFQLADHVKVNSANLENGLLEIHLKREVPEALKPKKIEIESNMFSKSAVEKIEKAGGKAIFI